MTNIRVLLVGFYNEKALGVRYLANAIEEHGYEPHVLFFKGFNSIEPSKATEKELEMLKELIEEIKPCFIGLSVMSSLYLETIHLVNETIKKHFDIPVAWGGVFATLMPEKAVHECDFVMRGEGEKTIVELLDALQKGESYEAIQNLAYLNAQGEMVCNEIRPLEQDIDLYGYPSIGADHMYLIHGDKIHRGDPQLHSFTYELNASRGCPFSCSYCSAINLRRLYKGKGRYVRFRTVESVMNELHEAKKKIPKLRVIHFWDEIFSDEEGWVEEFARRYKKEIGIPFRIWGHPMKVDKKIIAHLVDAGLHQIVVGVQSGSISVRKDTFHRPETQEQIIESSRILSECKVPKVYYDFMIRHPFENQEQLKETFYLCLDLAHPFSLNIHGLNFLPATDIVQMAIDKGYHTKEELEGMMFSSIQEQYDQYWGPNVYHKITADNLWVALIYLTQFPKIREEVLRLAKEVEAGRGQEEVLKLKDKMERKTKIGDYIDKAKLVLKIK